MIVSRILRRVRRVRLQECLCRHIVDYAESRTGMVLDAPAESTWSDVRRGEYGPESFALFLPDDELAQLVELVRQYGAAIERQERVEMIQPGDFVYAMY